MFGLQRVLGPQSETPVLEPSPLSGWGPVCDQRYVCGRQNKDPALTHLCDGLLLSQGSWESGQVPWGGLFLVRATGSKEERNRAGW